jgi:hypothetical protein
LLLVNVDGFLVIPWSIHILIATFIIVVIGWIRVVDYFFTLSSIASPQRDESPEAFDLESAWNSLSKDAAGFCFLGLPLHFLLFVDAGRFHFIITFFFFLNY